MRSKLIFSTLILLLAAFSLGGGVVAWFTSDTSTDVQTFSVGYLKLSEPIFVEEFGSGETAPWSAGATTTVSYRIENIGDRELYLRVRPMVDYIGSVTEGASFTINIVSGDWTQGTEGWWYYSSAVPAEPMELQSGADITALFEVFIHKDADGSVNFTLEAEGIQVSDTSVDKLWPEHPPAW